MHEYTVIIYNWQRTDHGDRLARHAARKERAAVEGEKGVVVVEAGAPALALSKATIFVNQLNIQTLKYFLRALRLYSVGCAGHGKKQKIHHDKNRRSGAANNLQCLEPDDLLGPGRAGDLLDLQRHWLFKARKEKFCETTAHVNSLRLALRHPTPGDVKLLMRWKLIRGGDRHAADACNTADNRVRLDGLSPHPQLLQLLLHRQFIQSFLPGEQVLRFVHGRVGAGVVLVCHFFIVILQSQQHSAACHCNE